MNDWIRIVQLDGRGGDEKGESDQRVWNGFTK